MKALSTGVFAAEVVAAFTLVGFGAYVGSTFLILAGMVGVPLILIGTLVLHFLNQAQRGSDLGKAQQRQFENALDEIGRSLQEAYRLAQKAGVPAAEVDAMVAEAQRIIAPHITVTVSDGSLHVAAGKELPPGNWILRTNQSLQRAMSAVAQRVAPSLEARLGDLEQWGDSVKRDLPRESVAATCRAYLDVLRSSTSQFDARLSSAEGAIADMESEGFVMDEAWGHLRSARRFWGEGQVDLSLRALQDAEAIVHDHLRPAFDERRRDLLSAIEQTRGLELTAAARPQSIDTLTKLKQEVENYDLRSVGLTALDHAEQRFAGVLQAVTRDAREKVKQVREVISPYPGLVDVESLDDLSEALDSAPDVKHPYQAAFPTWYDTMRLALGRIQKYAQDAALMRYYPRLESVIRDKLTKNRAVSAGDLPVRERASEILSIYARLHPEEVSFENGLMKLKGSATIG